MTGRGHLAQRGVTTGDPWGRGCGSQAPGLSRTVPPRSSLAPWPAVQVLTVLIDEQVHHGAEVGVLRNDYRCRQSRP